MCRVVGPPLGCRSPSPSLRCAVDQLTAARLDSQALYPPSRSDPSSNPSARRRTRILRSPSCGSPSPTHGVRRTGWTPPVSRARARKCTTWRASTSTPTCRHRLPSSPASWPHAPAHIGRRRAQDGARVAADTHRAHVDQSGVMALYDEGDPREAGKYGGLDLHRLAAGLDRGLSLAQRILCTTDVGVVVVGGGMRGLGDADQAEWNISAGGLFDRPQRGLDRSVRTVDPRRPPRNPSRCPSSRPPICVADAEGRGCGSSPVESFVTYRRADGHQRVLGTIARYGPTSWSLTPDTTSPGRQPPFDVPA